MLFCFPLNCSRVPITETNQSCWKHHIQPTENIVECISMFQAIKLYVYLTKTLVPVNLRGLMIELWPVWYFYWVCCSWALSTDITSYCTLHADCNIHMLYPWQPGAVVENSGLSVNLRSSEEQKEAEVYHVMTVSSPQDTENQASTLTWHRQSLSDTFLLILKTGSTTIIAFIYINKHNYVWIKLL